MKMRDNQLGQRANDFVRIKKLTAERNRIEMIHKHERKQLKHVHFVR